MASRLLLVALGGAAGAVLRALIGGWAARLTAGSLFPWGTLVVNVGGCFALGALLGATEGRGLSPEARALLVVGLLGGFTTFSTFAWESIDLARHLELGRLLLGVLGHVALGLLAAWAGWALLRPSG